MKKSDLEFALKDQLGEDVVESLFKAGFFHPKIAEMAAMKMFIHGFGGDGHLETYSIIRQYLNELETKCFCPLD